MAVGEPKRTGLEGAPNERLQGSDYSPTGRRHEWKSAATGEIGLKDPIERLIVRFGGIIRRALTELEREKGRTATPLLQSTQFTGPWSVDPCQLDQAVTPAFSVAVHICSPLRPFQNGPYLFNRFARSKKGVGLSYPPPFSSGRDGLTPARATVATVAT